MPRVEPVGSSTGIGGRHRSDLGLKREATGIAGEDATGPARSRAARYLLPAIIVIAIVNAVVTVGWHVIDPTDVSWIWGDPLESYIGWAFFRDEPQWNFPPLWAYRIGYPIGVSVSYLDTVPLAAISFRFVESVLPEHFQYLGILLLVGSVLQGYFGYTLFSKLFKGDAWLAALAACFVIVAPVFLFRAQAHFALTQQWLILAAFSSYFDVRIRAGPARYLLPFAGLLLLAGGIHPYLQLMIALIALAAVCRLLLERRATILFSAVALAGLAATGLTALVAFGFLSPGAAPSAYGYGTYSMNLLAPIDPHRFDALLWNELPIGANQYEGYSYLGLGVIVLLAVGAAAALSRGAGRPRTLLKPAIAALAILGAVCLFLAVLPGVTVGPWRLVDLPLPQVVLDALSPFQASGRLFWPATYLVIIAALALVQRYMSRRIAMALIAVLLVVQIADVASLYSDTRARWTTPTPQLHADEWRTLGQAHAHLVVIPAYQCDRVATPGSKGGFGTFGSLAIDQHMTINSYFAARTTDEAKQHFCEEMPEQLLSSGLQDDTAYVFAPEFLASLIAAGQMPTGHFCREADGFLLCAKDSRRAGIEDDLLQRYFPSTAIDLDLLFGPQASPGLVLDEGWSPGEEWGRWTDAPEASLTLRLAEPPPVPLAVAIKVNAFALESRHTQRVRVVIDGTEVADWEFTSSAVEVRTFPIPAAAIKPSGIVTVHFEMPDARRPIDLGLSGETRLLGLGAISMRVMRAEQR